MIAGSSSKGIITRMSTRQQSNFAQAIKLAPIAKPHDIAPQWVEISDNRSIGCWYNGVYLTMKAPVPMSDSDIQTLRDARYGI